MRPPSIPSITIREIHKAVTAEVHHASPSYERIAQRLNIAGFFLRFLLRNLKINFSELLCLSEKQAKELFDKKYDQVYYVENLDSINIENLLKLVQSASSLKKVAKQLRMLPANLERYLAKKLNTSFEKELVNRLRYEEIINALDKDSILNLHKLNVDDLDEKKLTDCLFAKHGIVVAGICYSINMTIPSEIDQTFRFILPDKKTVFKNKKMYAQLLHIFYQKIISSAFTLASKIYEHHQLFDYFSGRKIRLEDGCYVQITKEQLIDCYIFAETRDYRAFIKTLLGLHPRWLQPAAFYKRYPHSFFRADGPPQLFLGEDPSSKIASLVAKGSFLPSQ